MDEKDSTFEEGQQPSEHNVDENAHSNYSPSEQRSVKVLRLIIWVVQDDEPLDYRTRKDAAHGKCGDPRKRSEPPCKLSVLGSKGAEQIWK